MSNNTHNKKHTPRDSHKKNPTINSQLSTFEIYNSNYQSTDTIIKIILDKIISQSVRESFLKKINNELNSYCYNYLQNHINSLLEESYLSYTTISTQTPIFYKTFLPQENNNCIEIKEPETINDDRCEGNFVICKEFKKKKVTITSPLTRSTHRRSNKKYKTTRIHNYNLDKKIQELLNEQNTKTKIKNNFPTEKNINNKLLKINKNTNKNDESKDKKRKLPALDLPSYEIPNFVNFYNHECFDPPQILNLRKERELLIIKKNKERQEKLKEQNKGNLKLKEEFEKNNRKQKPFDFNKLTFDPNGNVIRFKQFNLENLNKGFLSPKNIIKEKSNKPKPQKNKKNVKSSDNIIGENITYNPNDFNRSNSVVSKPEKTLQSGSNFNIIFPSVGVIIKENQNIKEGSMEFNKYFNKYSLNDYDKMLNDYIPMQNKNNIKLSFQKEFSKISSLKNNVKSLSDDLINLNMNNNNNFNTINVSSNNNPLLSSNDNINMNSNRNLNSIDYKNSTSLTTNNILKMSNSNPYLRTSTNNNYNSSNNINPLLTSYNMRNSSSYKNFNLYRKSNFNDSITMSKMGIKSLKSEIDKLKELNNEDGIFNYIADMKKNIRNRNIFKSNFRSNYKNLLKKEIKISFVEDFNKKIIMDKNWGDELGGGGNKKPNIIFAKHHTRSQALRELGSSIFKNIKIKLPRDRRIELNI